MFEALGRWRGPAADEPSLSPAEVQQQAQQRRAAAAAAALARLPDSPAAVAALQEEGGALAANYAGRPDGFFLRFLQFNESFHRERPAPEQALTMLLNYCRFMQSQREKAGSTGSASRCSGRT